MRLRCKQYQPRSTLTTRLLLNCTTRSFPLFASINYLYWYGSWISNRGHYVLLSVLVCASRKERWPPDVTSIVGWAPILSNAIPKRLLAWYPISQQRQFHQTSVDFAFRPEINWLGFNVLRRQGQGHYKVKCEELWNAISSEGSTHFLLCARYVPSLLGKTSNGHISATDHPIHFQIGSRVGLSGLANLTVPFILTPKWPSLP